MKYFIQNTDLDNKISDIRRKIRLSMNGVVADKMTKDGIIYKKNYGVDIPRIREIAKAYSQNKDLAHRLWALQIRETMIIATILQPVESFTEEMAEEWLVSINQTEIVEQTCMNLFSKLPYAAKLCMKWIESDDKWVRITSIILAARIWRQFDRENVEFLLAKSVELADTSDFHQYKAISLLMCRLCRQGKDVSSLIMNEIKHFENSEKPSLRYIFGEIYNEISFLNFL